MSDDSNLRASGAQETEEQELCAQCLAANRPGAAFCGDCGAPLSSYAATGPFECLFAEGYVYRRAAEQPRRLIVVLGVWLIFGSLAATGLLLICTAPAIGMGYVVIGALMLALSIELISKTTRNYLTWKKLIAHGNA